MMLTGKGVVRLLWLANILILLAVLLPIMLDHPYPKQAAAWRWSGGFATARAYARGGGLAKGSDARHGKRD